MADAVEDLVAQTQSYFNHPANDGTLLTFNKYSGPGTITQVDIFATGLARVQGTIDQPSAEQFNVNATIQAFGFMGDSNTPPGAGAIVLLATPTDIGPYLVFDALTVPSYGPMDYVNQVNSSITDPLLLAGFASSGTFSYQAAAGIVVSPEAPAILQPNDQMSVEIRMVYHVEVPEPASLALLAAGAGMILRRRR